MVSFCLHISSLLAWFFSHWRVFFFICVFCVLFAWFLFYLRVLCFLFAWFLFYLRVLFFICVVPFLFAWFLLCCCVLQIMGHRSLDVETKQGIATLKTREDFCHVLGNQIPSHVSSFIRQQHDVWRFLEGKLDAFLFNQHGSHSAFPIIPNLCHFQPFEKTSKLSLLGHIVRV